MKQNPFIRCIVVILIAGLITDPSLASTTAHESVAVRSNLFAEQALSLTPVSVMISGVRLLSKLWLRPLRLWRRLTFKTSKIGPFEGMYPGDPVRIIEGREYSIEPMGDVFIFWSKPINFTDGQPIYFLNTGMSALELLRATDIMLRRKSVIDKYWIAGGYATALETTGAAVAQVVGSQSDLKSIQRRSVWQVARERVTEPLRVIAKRYPKSSDHLHIHGLSTGAVLQVCYLADGGRAESATETNGVFEFADGSLHIMGFERRMRWMEYENGAELFVNSLTPGTAESIEFLVELHDKFARQASNAEKLDHPRVLFIGTWTEKGIELNWSIFPEWVGQLLGERVSDGIVKLKLALNQGPRGKVVPWAQARSPKGITHNQAQGSERVQRLALDNSAGRTLEPELDSDRPAFDLPTTSVKEKPGSALNEYTENGGSNTKKSALRMVSKEIRPITLNVCRIVS